MIMPPRTGLARAKGMAKSALDVWPAAKAVAYAADDVGRGLRQRLGRIGSESGSTHRAICVSHPELLPIWTAARSGQAEVRCPELRPDPQEDDQAEAQGEVLPGREDPDLLGAELVQMADRDGECARDREHGDIRKEERGDGAHQDRPEPPARWLDPGCDEV